MLNSSLAYILMRSLPESILFMLAGHILLDLSLDKRKIFYNGLILGAVVSLIRFMPINYGIHTILAMMTGGFMLYKSCNLPILNSIIATCGNFIALGISEGIYVGIAVGILGVDMNLLMSREFKGAIVTMPSLAIFLLVIIFMKFIINRIKIKSNSI